MQDIFNACLLAEPLPGAWKNEVLIIIYNLVVMTQRLAKPTEFQHEKYKKNSLW